MRFKSVRVLEVPESLKVEQTTDKRNNLGDGLQVLGPQRQRPLRGQPFGARREGPTLHARPTGADGDERLDQARRTDGVEDIVLRVLAVHGQPPMGVLP